MIALQILGSLGMLGEDTRQHMNTCYSVVLSVVVLKLGASEHSNIVCSSLHGTHTFFFFFLREKVSAKVKNIVLEPV